MRQTRAVVAPVAQNFTGRFRFPGEFAFLEKYNIADFALLQADEPFTGVFSQAAAENTCAQLAAQQQDGDVANLSGKLVTCDVEGRQTPVLFLFG